MNAELKAYIEQAILPAYEHFDPAHRIDHAQKVIAESLVLAQQYDTNVDMAYTIAAYHDLGLSVDRKLHHIHSGKILMADTELPRWFSAEQLLLMKEAVEDHRASAEQAPRSLYGCIVAEADRDIVPQTVIKRTIQYGQKHYADQQDMEFHYQRTLEHVQTKYGEGGYLKLCLSSAKNLNGLREIRLLLSDQQAFRAEFERIYAEVNEE